MIFDTDEASRANPSLCLRCPVQSKIMRRYTKLTTRSLEHALSWGDKIRVNFRWTRSDNRTYEIILGVLKRMRNEYYETRKKYPKTASRRLRY